ncbi:MAG TPA: asparaginase, partial [Streptosporangiaceae bacterium]|nr:asparaginase [Streptosporangiaceae bacterium]
MPVSPRVVVLALGGTIAMSPGDTAPGVVPTLTAEDLVAAVPSLRHGVRVEARTLVNRPSASLTMSDLLALLREAGGAIRDGAQGVVVTQGTDNLEETSFLLDLLWPHSEPLVITGAMRGPTLPGADGPANLAAAVAVAVDPASRDTGVLVVINDQVHAARYVRKEHSHSPAAFVSPTAGPVGSVKEGKVVHRVRPQRRTARLDPPCGPTARVALIEATFDDGGDLLSERVTAPYDGVVVAAFGAGHLSERAADAAITLAATKPVVLATRCGAGGPLQSTYGFHGSETHLLANGL